jgi:hypothetical protein
MVSFWIGHPAFVGAKPVKGDMKKAMGFPMAFG